VPLGSPRRHFRVTDSTNQRARELAREGAPHGTVVTAEEQTAGRGRQGRSWVAPRGQALLCSYVVRPLAEHNELMPLAVPLAVCEAAELLGAPSCGVKWPNDVWVGDRKLAGVLIEARPGEDWAVIGVGLNVSVEPAELPLELRDRAVSIGGDATPGGALAALNGALEDWLKATREAVLTGFRERDALAGRPVRWDGGFGVAAGVDGDGGLVVSLASGESVSLRAGEVHLSV